MYKAVFYSDNGKEYHFGKKDNTIFDMDVGEGMSIDLGTSQGFAQMGTTVENKTVSGRTITVKGVVYGNIPEKKRNLRNVFAPFASGKFVFENDYFTRVYVKSAPTFSPVRDDGRFTMQLYAPFPFFYSNSETSGAIGAIIPSFRFPVDYSTPHIFGVKSPNRHSTLNNVGDVPVPFKAVITTPTESTNVKITNLATFDFLQINGIITAGQIVEVYRDELNVFHAELIEDGVTTDIISRIDEGSTLFELNVGDNIISANDDEGGGNLSVSISFRPAVGAVYES